MSAVSNHVIFMQSFIDVIKLLRQVHFVMGNEQQDIAKHIKLHRRSKNEV
jgi:hypothetical protein